MKPWPWLLAGLLLWPAGAPAGEAGQTPAGKGAVYHVPYRLTDTVHVLVRAKINGRGPFNFIIDTGAPINIVSEEVGRQLGLKADRDGWATADRFEIEGGVRHEKFKLLVETPFQIEGMNAMNFAGVPLHGIVGYSLLARYKLQFDFAHHKMEWTELGHTPADPLRLGAGGGAPGGLDAMGTLMKVVSLVVGKMPSPELRPRGFVGVEVRQLEAGVEVTGVYDGGPAARAGLRAGDAVESVGGDRVGTVAELGRKLAAVEPGAAVEFRVRRGGETVQLTVTAGEGL